MNTYCKYLSIGAVEENWGLYVNTAGYSKVKPNQSYPRNDEHPSSHTFSWNKGRVLKGYQLIFISKGEGIFESEFTQPAIVTEGTCLLLHSGVWHRYKPKADSGWEEYWLGFNGSFADELMNKGFFNVNLPFIKVGLCSEVLNLFHKLIETIQASSPGYPQIIAGITVQILGVIYSLSQEQEKKKNPVGMLIDKAIFLLQESLEKPVDIERMAKDLPMGYSSFRKAFKKITGEPPNQFLLNLRLNRAKWLLDSTDLSINEIAYQSGFESVYYFSKLFKKRNGISPKFYRNPHVESINS